MRKRNQLEFRKPALKKVTSASKHIETVIKADEHQRAFGVITVAAGGVFLAGLTAGAVFSKVGSANGVPYAQAVAERYLARCIESEPSAVFSASFLGQTCILLCCFLLGFCVFGAPGQYILLFFRGAGAGLLSGYLLCAYAWNGVLFNTLLLYPSLLIRSTALLALAADGTRQAANIYRRIIKDEDVKTKEPTAAFCTLFARCCVMSLIASAVETASVCTLAGLFL